MNSSAPTSVSCCWPGHVFTGRWPMAAVGMPVGTGTSGPATAHGDVASPAAQCDQETRTKTDSRPSVVTVGKAQKHSHE